MAAHLALTMRGGVSNLPHPVAGGRETAQDKAARPVHFSVFFACRITRKVPGFEQVSFGSLCAPHRKERTFRLPVI